MRRQIEMENKMILAHREFMESLEGSLDLLEGDINEACEMSQICTDEWCQSTEVVLDELNNLTNSITEPRWLSKEDSHKIKALRSRIHDMYELYKSAKG